MFGRDTKRANINEHETDQTKILSDSLNVNEMKQRIVRNIILTIILRERYLMLTDAHGYERYERIRPDAINTHVVAVTRWGLHVVEPNYNQVTRGSYERQLI